MGSSGQYTQGWFAFVGHKSEVGTPTRASASTLLSMGSITTPNTQNSELVWPLYLDSVTWKVADVHVTNGNYGIATYIFGATTIGTIDYYSAGTVSNVYAEITGFVNVTPQAADLTVRAATKNASSTGYYLELMSIALIRTGGTPSTPAGTDTPGYTWEHVWWMGNKDSTNVGPGGTGANAQDSGMLSGGYAGRSAPSAQNDQVNNDVWLDAGTFTYSQVHLTSSDIGIYTVKYDGSSLGTIDGYSGSTTKNVYSELTGLAITADTAPRNFQLIMATKNASSSAYSTAIASGKFVRTGA